MLGISGKSVCFTGHRPQSINYLWNESSMETKLLSEAIKKEVEYLIVNKGVKHFVSGMAIGVDMISAEIVLDLKKSIHI